MSKSLQKRAKLIDVMLLVAKSHLSKYATNN